jgi:hypothetical protein
LLGFTVWLPIQKLVAKNCVAADSEISSKNYVTIDSEIGSQTVPLPIQKSTAMVESFRLYLFFL